MSAQASAIILAGGQSRRMGQPKAALRFGKGTILEQIIEQLWSSFDDLVVVAAPADTEPFAIESLLRDHLANLRLLRDERPYQGAAVALANALGAARHEIVFACSCDMPLLRAEVAYALCELLDAYDAVIPEIAGNLQPLCAVYRRNAAAIIERQLEAGERRLTRIAARLNAYRPDETRMRQIDPTLDSFLNVNTPEDYARMWAMKQLR